MKFSIISDIHSNYEGLTEILKYILTEKTDYLFVCGDIIGYGPDPELCLEKIFSITDLIVKGNHEEGIITGNYSRFKKLATISLEWTEKKITNYIEKIKCLPVKITFGDITFVHACLSDPIYKYILSKKDAAREFELFSNKICFYGHTHIPSAYKKNLKTNNIETIIPDFNGKMCFKIEDDYKYLINVGSSGQPRDGLPMVCISIYDSENKTFKLSRLNYPVEITKNKILERGLPSSLGEKFLKGI